MSYVRDEVTYPTYGAYLRGKSLSVEGCRSATGGPDRTAQKDWDRNLQSYRDARAQGIQPAGTKQYQVNEAVDLSNKAGAAYNAGTGSFTKTGV